MKKVKNPLPSSATWFEHQQLLFWLEACIKDAKTYLVSSQNASIAFEKIFSNNLESVSEYKHVYEQCQDQNELDKYHFILVMGNLLRILKRAQHLFPIIQPAYSKAIHFLTEGKSLRDMIEHSHGNDGYLAGGGKNPEKYIRHNAPEPGCSCDATSTIINRQGHWLGGRLCVEQILDEITTIYKVAINIPPPSNE